MRLFFGLLVTIFASSSGYAQAYLASPIQALPPNWNQVAGDTVPMPPIYSPESRDIGFCYGFTAATLINQMLWSKERKSYEPVSMLDLSINGSGMSSLDVMRGESMKPKPQLHDLGNSYRVLIYGVLKRQIAPESCMPFDRLNLLKSSNPKRFESFQSFVETIFAAYSSKPESSKNLDQVSNELLSLEPSLGNSKSEVEELFKQATVHSNEDIFSLMGSLLIPRKCESRRLRIPFSSVTNYKINPNNRADLLPHLKSTLSRKRPLGFPFCINDACDEQHVLVISGWRRLCAPEGKCQEQFLLRDSGAQVAPRPGDYWVDSGEILEKVDIMLSQYGSLESAPDLVMNLEY